MDKSILKRLEALENRPEGQIPRLCVEYEDGHTETVYGFAILAMQECVRRVTYDGQHQPSVDAAALYIALCGDGVEVVPYAQC